MLAGVAWSSRAAAAFDVAWTAGALCAFLGLRAARRSATGESRAAWTWLSVAALAWLFGQLAWDAFAVVGSPPSPNAADVGWWAFAVLVIAGVLPASGRGRGLRAVGYVEALPLVAAAMALTCALMWSHVTHSSLPTAARVSALVYPALYVSAAVVTMQAIVAGTLRRTGGVGVLFVLFGAVMQAAAFILWSRQLLDGDYVIGRTLIDPLFVLGLVAIGAGGAAAGRTPGRPGPEAETNDRGVVLPAATFALLIAALVQCQVTSAPLGARLTLTAGLTICGLTLIARGVLLAQRQRGLLAAEREARAALSERESQLQRLTEQLVEDARRDPLTGLRNRRALAEDLPMVEHQSRRRGSSHAVLLCDVDHFKAYNDALGHLAGDEALRTLAALVRGELRGGDVAYRYGGEELLVILHDASVLDGVEAAERLRHVVAREGLPHPLGIDGIVTVSIGVAAGGEDAERLLMDADAALYRAKREGRNRVVAADADVVVAAPARSHLVDRGSAEPGVRRLQSLLAVSRAARTGEGPVAVLEALAQVIRSELRFAVVVGNLRAPDGDSVAVAVVLGEPDVRDALLGTTTAWSEWEAMLRPENDRCGAVWLPAGTYEWSTGMTAWIPTASARPAADAWQPQDALLLPLRDASGEVLAIIAVDEPLSGRRPDDDAIEVLMAIANHGAAIFEQIAHEHAMLEAASARGSAQQLSAVMLLAESLDLRDAGTAHHCKTVGEFTRAIAEELGLADDRVQRLYTAGILHDLGKLAVPDAVLHKPGPLDDAEWREMRRHPETGARILSHAGLVDIAAWVHAHHERVDGRGYPLELMGDNIPLEARILAVADAYEAMIADRPYRAGMSREAAQEELRANAGTQFDRAVVAAFLRTLAASADRGQRQKAGVT
jgi:diguanylate cyclase (GGDEF)-like protein/putative nucleotidyltransferase with HDIG domain